jgi:hypothetical protein
MIAALSSGMLLTCATTVGSDCPSTAFVRSPTLISHLEPFKQAGRSAKYIGRVSVRLTVTDTGAVRDVKITGPTRLNTVPDVTDQVRRWRFCPAVVYSKYRTVPFQITIDVSDEF